MVSFDAVVFDMDGVLFDTESVSNRSWREVAREMQIADIETALAACVGRNPQGIREFFLGHFGKDFDFDAFMSRSSQIFQEILEREGLRLMPGVIEILTFLRAQGKGIALASSTRYEGVMHHINAAGIAHYFDAVMTGDRVEHGKPHPEIYLKACEMLGRDPKRCIAIEDSPNGIRSAHAAGMRAVMVPDQIAPDNAIRVYTHVIRDSLLDVIKWLKTPASTERWDAYDAQGQRTGETLTRGETIPAGRYHAVVSTALRHADGDFLFMRRDERKEGCPGLWECTAGGSVLAGETVQDGAWRELREETGIESGRMRLLSTRLEGDSIYHQFLCVTDAPKRSVTLQEGETVDFRWLSRRELGTFLQSGACVPGDVTLLETILQGDEIK